MEMKYVVPDMAQSFGTLEFAGESDHVFDRDKDNRRFFARRSYNLYSDVQRGENVVVEIPVAGMVKDDYHRTRGLYYENREIDFGKNRDAFHLITRIQDEAHRFAISYHRKLRSDQQVRSVLDQIPGIGSVRRKALLRQFGSVDTIKTLSVDELKKAEGMNLPAAEAVYTFFHTRKEDPDHAAPDHT